jgi:hypothetical protein
MRRYTSTPPLIFMTWCLVKHYLYLYVVFLCPPVTSSLLGPNTVLHTLFSTQSSYTNFNYVRDFVTVIICPAHKVVQPHTQLLPHMHRYRDSRLNFSMVVLYNPSSPLVLFKVS